MDDRQFRILALRETDIKGAIHRCNGNEKLYTECLKGFLKDNTVSELNEAISRNDWDEAFTAAHALKGLAGNMGFIPLMHATGQLVILVRGGRLYEINSMLNEVNSCYRDITDAINQFLVISYNNSD